MNLLQEIRKYTKSSKLMLERLSRSLLKNPELISSIKSDLESASPTERGAYMEIIEYASKQDPAFVKPYIPVIISYLADKAPRVKWEAARILGNSAQRFPDETTKSIERLLENAKDSGTVVRWSAAFALGEIAKYSEKARPKLLITMNQVIKNEKNTGVKNVYLKSLKNISTEK